MRLIPSTVYRFHSDAEKKVFDLLKRLDLGEGACALHSQNISEISYKEWCEIDFVLVCEWGVLVLEIKGGHVSRKDGVWNFRDRYGQTHRKSEGPFEQAQSGKYALKDALKKKVNLKKVESISFGWGCVFPDMHFNTETPEVPAEAIIDHLNVSGFREFRSCLNNLGQYWYNKKSRYRKLDRSDIDIICAELRPNFDLVPTLASRVDQISEQLVSLTDDQYRIMDAVENTERIICTGGAGTGKSFLAVQAARSEAQKGKAVELVCRSDVFAAFIRPQLDKYNVQVSDIRAITNGPQPEGGDLFDSLIVDEAQDLMNSSFLDLFKNRLKGGIENGCWRFFLDGNNQGGVYGDYDAFAFDYLCSLTGMPPMRLSINCRNTPEIITQTQLMTGADIGVSKLDGQGVKVTFATCSDAGECASLAVVQLNAWMDDGIELSNVTILSCAAGEDSCLRKLGAKWKKILYRVDAGNIASRPHNKLGYCEVADFKGLESMHIMLVDLEDISDSPEQIAHLYVAITRANAVLWIAIPESKQEFFDTLKAKNSARMLGASNSHGGN
jgi:hypothetical protein